jgi:hypothetical protein
MKMNQNGNMIIIILIAFVILALIPPLIMTVFPIADIIMRIILALIIFITVRGYIGDGPLSLIISGIIIYFLVIKWALFTASAYIFLYFLLSFSFLSVIVWGIGMNLKK